MSDFAKLLPDQYHQKFIDNKIRTDGRTFTTVRKTLIQQHYLDNSDGSSLVKIGDTSVVCSIDLRVGIPEISTPLFGKLNVNVKLSNVSSSNVSSLVIPLTEALHLGSMSSNFKDHGTLSHYFERLLIDSHFINLESFSIIPSIASWMVNVEIASLSHDGNFMDAAILSLITAFKDLKIPVTYTPDEKVVYVREGGEKMTFPTGKKLYPLTGALYKNVIIYDPNSEEESLSSSNFTVVFNESGELCNFYKPGGESISNEIMVSILQNAAGRSGSLNTIDHLSLQNSLPSQDLSVLTAIKE